MENRVHIGMDHFESFRRGEEKGFEYYFKTYYKALCFFARQYAGDDDVSADIVSEAFIAAWERRESMTDDKHLRNWLYQSVRWGSLKQSKKTRELEAERWSDVIAEENDLFENLVKTEALMELREAIESLPNECRKIFSKLFIDEQTVEEIAKELKVTASTIYNQKMRGIKLLRMKWRRE